MFSDGSVVIGTGDDDLREGSAVWVRIHLRSRPAVVFEAARGRRFPDRTDTPPIAWRLAPSHDPPVRIEDVERIEIAFSPDRRDFMEDDKWWFTGLIVTVNDTAGPTVLYSNTAVNHKFERAGAWSTGILPTFSAIGATLIRVFDEAGSPVRNADVFIDTFIGNTSVRTGATDATGQLLVPSSSLQPTSTILVRSRIHEQDYYRSQHAFDSTQNWNYRVYHTNVRIDNRGIAFPTLGPFGSVVDVTVRRDHTLIGLNLLVSAEWDLASSDQATIEAIMNSCSRYLYNATDGQFFIEVAQIGDRRDAWDDSDFRIFADWGYRANVPNIRGAFLGWNVLGSAMKMSRSNGAPVYAHEFGHYGLALGDEYRDGAMTACTRSVRSPSSIYAAGRTHSSCMMWSQGQAPKLCSSHRSNPHVRGTRQGDEACWDTITRRYNIDSRWNVRTPVDRDAIPPRIRSVWSADGFMSSFVLPTIQRRAVANLFGLIGELTLTITETGGAPIAGVVVKTRDADGSWILQGRTAANGTLLIAGIHGGDRLRLEPGGGLAFERDIPSSASGTLSVAISS